MSMGKQLTFTFQPDKEMLEILKEQADLQDRSVSWLINHYIKKSLAADGLFKPKGKGKK